MRSKVKITQICDGISTTLQFAYFFIKHRLVACQIDQLEETNQGSDNDFSVKGQLFKINEVKGQN